MAYQPDDDRFYNILNKSGDQYIAQRGRVAEDQADTTRQIGQMYGQLAPNMVNGALTGANWAMKRGTDQQLMDARAQAMDLAQSQEGRAGAEEGRKVAKFGQEQKDWADKDAERAFAAAPAEEGYAKAAGVDYTPGMTHADVQHQAAGSALGRPERELTQKGEIAQGVQAGENSRAGQTIGAAAARQQEMLAFEREKLAQEGMLAMNKPPVKAPAELVSKLGEADFAEKALGQLAKEWQDKASGTGASIMQYIPNSDAARYGDAAKTNAQIVGKFLEEGKMTDADVPKYERMLPGNGDTPERAKEKLERLSLLIAQKKKSHVDALTAAGYSTGMASGEGAGQTFDLHKPNAAGTAIAAPTGKPKSVIQNGHTYILNEQTGQYE